MRLIEFSVNGHKPVKRRVRKYIKGVSYELLCSESFNQKSGHKKPASPQKTHSAKADGFCHAYYGRGLSMAGASRRNGRRARLHRDFVHRANGLVPAFQ